MVLLSERVGRLAAGDATQRWGQVFYVYGTFEQSSRENSLFDGAFGTKLSSRVFILRGQVPVNSVQFLGHCAIKLWLDRGIAVLGYGNRSKVSYLDCV